MRKRTVKFSSESKVIGLSIILVLLFWSFTIYIANFFVESGQTTFISYFHDQNWERLGQLGATFGIISALFSGLAFAAIFGTFVIQRSDFKISRENQEKQQEQLERQAELIRRQTFENTFFKLLEFFLEKKPADKINDCFWDLSQLLEGRGHEQRNEVETDYNEIFLGGDLIYLEVYFWNIFHILEFVDNSAFEDGDKKFFVNIFKGYLTGKELFLLFYHALLGIPSPYYKSLIELYSVLEHIWLDELSEPLISLIENKHKYFYEPNAFGFHDYYPLSYKKHFSP